MENEHELSYETLKRVYLGSYENYKGIGKEVELLEPGFELQGSKIVEMGQFGITSYGYWLWIVSVSTGASFTQGTISSIPIGGNISLEGFLLPILLLVVIIVMVVIVVVILIVVVAIIGAVVVSSDDIIDLIGDEDPTDEDGHTEVSVSLGEISSKGKKSWELDIGDCNNTGDRGKTAGRAIITWGGEIALYACMASIYGSSCKGEKISMSKRYLVKSLRELFLGIIGK
uniref:Uncharacterized protein n=1 Tax=Tanacetum cinerariifolium TaxID=118510 RepID=A0A6L2KVH3_TANCI|nr:hypothetical protein [Tanacetum cinerariifolium]